MQQLTEQEGREARQSCDKRWRHGPPPLDFHGAGGRGRCLWLCQRACSSGTGTDGPQAEERATAADAQCIAQVLCDEFLFFVFLAKVLKKTRSVRLWKKGPAKFRNVCFYSNSLTYCMIPRHIISNGFPC
jgi:hypothetical protein